MTLDGWIRKPLGEFVTLQRGHDLPDEQRRAGSVPIYGSFGITGWHDEVKAPGPGVTVGRSGASFGVVSYSPVDYWPLNTVLYVIDFHGNNERFAYYLLKHFDFQGYNSGSAQPSLNRNYIHPVPIDVPPLPEQHAIARILGTLDDKIELNRRINETLEAMARAIFKSWFVDSDPVRAKVADLIRDGVLEIGDGYRAKNSELGNSGLPFIRAGDLNDGFDTAGAELLTEDSVVKAGSKVCRVGDVAFTSKGTIGRFARVTEYTAKFVYSPQVCYWRSLDPTQLHPAVLYCWMQSDDFKEQITAIAGQTDMAPYVSLQDQRRMSMPIFPKSQHAVASRIEPLLARQSCNAAQTKTLDELCDALLLKLISGALRVKDAERFLRRMSA
jgi:type I restriction enzyme S subunit